MVTRSVTSAGHAQFPKFPKESIRKAVQWVAATQAKVEMVVIADVRAGMAERKRKREEDGAQTQAAGAQAKQRRQDRRRENNMADVDDAIAEHKTGKENWAKTNHTKRNGP